MGRLDGKVAVVTGCSQGIGLAVAKGLAGDGASLVISARRGDVLREAAAEIEAGGTKVVTVQADVARREDANRTIAAAIENFGRLDILVNNAQASQQAKSRILPTRGSHSPSARGFSARSITCRLPFRTSRSAAGR